MLLHRASFKVMIWNGFPELVGKELKLRYTGRGPFGTYVPRSCFNACPT